MESELKNCPFCGGEPVVRQIGNEHTKKLKVEVRCKTLGCRGSCEGQATLRMRNSKEQVEKWAIEQWNKRPSPAAVVMSHEAVAIPYPSSDEQPTEGVIELVLMSDRLRIGKKYKITISEAE